MILIGGGLRPVIIQGKFNGSKQKLNELNNLESTLEDLQNDYYNWYYDYTKQLNNDGITLDRPVGKKHSDIYQGGGNYSQWLQNEIDFYQNKVNNEKRDFEAMAYALLQYKYKGFNDSLKTLDKNNPESVLLLQRQLNDLGYNIQEDGKYGPLTDMAYLLAKMSSLQNIEYKQPKYRTLEDLQKQDELLNKSMNNILLIHYYNRNTNKPYLIDDKKNDKMYLCFNGVVIREYEARHGKNSKTMGNTFHKRVKTKKPEYYEVKLGDTLFHLAKLYGVKLNDLVSYNNISDPNKIYERLKIKIPKNGYDEVLTEIDPDEDTITYIEGDDLANYKGNNTTPAGVFYIKVGDQIYNGALPIIRQTKEMYEKDPNGAGVASSIHAYPKMDKGTYSNGCTRMNVSDVQLLGLLLDGFQGLNCYVLPSNKSNKFVSQEGQLAFKSLNANVHNYRNTDYKPIIINNTKEVYDTARIDSEIGFIKNYFTGNQRSLQEEFNLSSETYAKMVQALIGIAGAETSYGSHLNLLEGVVRLAWKAVGGGGSFLSK